MADPVTAAATAPWWGPPALAAGAALGEGLASSAFNLFQANKNRDWQERMSGSAHQREVEDLKKAGLNPMLSIRHGGASTPSGAMAQASIPEGIISSATQAALVRGQLGIQDATIRDINSAAALKDTQAADITTTQSHRLGQMLAQAYQALQSGNLSAEQRPKVIQEIRNLESQKRLTDLQANHSAAQLHKEQLKGSLFEQGKKVLEAIKAPPQHPAQFDWNKYQKKGNSWFERNIYKKPEGR